MSLETYNKKRNFKVTSEPAGKAGKKRGKALTFCVQKHDATRLHYDFRLELDGVLKSWAVTRGPSLHPGEKRLAVQVEDHPFAYRTFEGTIPKGEYGGGTVMLWDDGTWEPVNDPHEGLAKGHLTFILHGDRLKGEFALIRMHRRDGETRDNWLLVKADKDEWVLTEKQDAVFLDKNMTSVKSHRTMEEIAGTAAVWHSKTTDGKAPPPAHRKTPKSGIVKAAAVKLNERKLPDALRRRAAEGDNGKALDGLIKQFPEVQLATLVEFPPQGAGWRHEIKYDGYRIMAFVADGKVVMRTRGGLDWTARFKALADELATLGAATAVLDGEIVVLDDKGASDFGALKTALSNDDQGDMRLYLFDLLHLNGDNLAKQPLSARQDALAKLLDRQKKAPHLHLSEHLESDEDLLPTVCSLGAEGIVSKLSNAPYSFRRNRDWVKSKCGQEQEFVIGGFVPASDDPKKIGALHLGFYRSGKLSFAGKVGTGYTHKAAGEMFKLLKPLQRQDMPFTDNMPPKERGAVWVEPSQLCQVKFWEWTPDRHIRHASFKGLREDKKAREVVQEVPEKPPEARAPKPAAEPKSRSKRASQGKTGDLDLDHIHVTHPDRVMFPDVNVTKGDVARYYDAAMPYLLPFLEKRPISVIRFPGDIDGEAFFQRNPMQGVSREVQPVHFSYKNVKRTYFYIDSAEGVMSLVQMGAIEFHPWGVHVNDVHHPDQLIFDLDPDPSVSFEAVKLAALDMKHRLDRLKLKSFVRTTGGKGLHVTVPILPEHRWDEAKEWSRRFCQAMVAETPEAYVANMSKAKRTGKIFLDFFRNDYTSTAVTCFVIRGRKGAPVAMPVTWKEMEGLKSAAEFTIRNAPERFNAATRKLIKAQIDCEQSLDITSL